MVHGLTSIYLKRGGKSSSSLTGFTTGRGTKSKACGRYKVSDALPVKLCLIQLAVQPGLCEQFVMRAAFDDLTSIHHQN